MTDPEQFNDFLSLLTPANVALIRG